MRRMGWMAVVLVVAGCSSLQIDTLQLDRDAPPESWRQSGQVDVAIQLPLEEVWRYNGGAGFGPEALMVSGKVIFISNRKGEVHAVDAETGKKLGLEEFGESVESATMTDGRYLYLASTKGRRKVFAYDMQKGRTEWRRRAEPSDAGIVLHDDLILTADLFGTIRAHQQATGDEVWSIEIGSEEDPTGVKAPLRLTNDGHLIATDIDGRVYRIDAATGNIRWDMQVGAPIYQAPALTDDAVYVPTTRGSLVVLDAATGAKRWHRTLPDSTIRFATPAAANDMVVTATTDGLVEAHDPQSGVVLWSFASPDAISAAPLITQDHVFVGSLGKQLYVLDRDTGAMLEEHEVKGRIKTAIAAYDDSVIVLCEPQHIYRFATRTAEEVADAR
ncbi:MAG: PQQ-binding-like beta-propeller repeat protein [Bacteroidota bacterium]